MKKNREQAGILFAAAAALGACMAVSGGAAPLSAAAASSADTGAAKGKVSAKAGEAVEKSARSASGGSSQITAISPQILNSQMKTGDLAALTQPDQPEIISGKEEQSISRAMRAYVQPAESLLFNNADTFYYYGQLDEDGQFLYDTLQMVAEDPGSAENYAALSTDLDPGSEEFAEVFYQSYMALVYDHPEYYWLYNFSRTSFGVYSTGEKTDGYYTVYVCLDEPYEDYEEEITKFNDAAKEFLADIDTSGSEKETALQIHDKLIGMVTYDTAVSDAGTGGYFDLAHTAYGALVKDSSGDAHRAVCDGYSLAYEYLLQQCGIEVIFMPGYGSDSDANLNDTCGHAWNLARIDGRWTEADATWDDTDYADYLDGVDPSVQGYDLVKEAIADETYVDTLRHAYFGLSTPRIRHFSPDEEEFFTNSDGLKYSLISESVHVRDSEYNPESVMGVLSATAPDAG